MSKQVLVVDDSYSMRAVVKLTLETDAFSVIEASDGEEAIQCLHTHTVNLVVSDIKMPRKDGWSLMQYIKTSGQFKSLPVVLMTSHKDQETKLHPLKDQADAYLTKPFKPDCLLTVVKKLVQETL